MYIVGVGKISGSSCTLRLNARGQQVFPSQFCHQGVSFYSHGINDISILLQIKEYKTKCKNIIILKFIFQNCGSPELAGFSWPVLPPRCELEVLGENGPAALRPQRKAETQRDPDRPTCSALGLPQTWSRQSDEKFSEIFLGSSFVCQFIKQPKSRFQCWKE